jgi:glycosyltransferase involved in cell wall biosynthesis
MVKVVHIQYSTASAGGAALRLQKALINAGLQSNIISLERDDHQLEGIVYLNKREKFVAKINSKIQEHLSRKIPQQFGLFSHTILGNDISKIQEIKEADYIYVHWVLNGFLSLNNFKQLADLKKPIIFFMHDMWSFTGGCHYSFTCDNYKAGCHNCQMFQGSEKQWLPARNFEKKMRLFSKYDNFYFVSPSKWLFDCARQSLITEKKPVFYIPNVLDKTIFKPYNKTVARQLLNINEEEKVIAFGAVSLSSPYKGWPYLKHSMQILYTQIGIKNITVLIFGSGYNKEIADSIPFKTKFMGYLCDEYSTALVYNAADVFIVPSLADNQPTIVQESLACGTPVVGFNIGGIPDMIKHKENGYLAEYKNSEDIVAGIKFCIDNELKGGMLPQFETETTVNKHLELFDYIKKAESIKK